MGTKYPGLRKVGEFWHYSLKVNGQRAHGSTKAKDFGTAKKVIDERRKELLSGQLGIASKILNLTALVREWLKVYQKIHSSKHLAQVEQLTRMWILPALARVRRTGEQKFSWAVSCCTCLMLSRNISTTVRSRRLNPQR